MRPHRPLPCRRVAQEGRGFPGATIARTSLPARPTGRSPSQLALETPRKPRPHSLSCCIHCRTFPRHSSMPSRARRLRHLLLLVAACPAVASALTETYAGVLLPDNTEGPIPVVVELRDVGTILTGKVDAGFPLSGKAAISSGENRSGQCNLKVVLNSAVTLRLQGSCRPSAVRGQVHGLLHAAQHRVPGQLSPAAQAAGGSEEDRIAQRGGDDQRHRLPEGQRPLPDRLPTRRSGCRVPVREPLPVETAGLQEQGGQGALRRAHFPRAAQAPSARPVHGHDLASQSRAMSCAKSLGVAGLAVDLMYARLRSHEAGLSLPTVRNRLTSVSAIRVGSSIQSTMARRRLAAFRTELIDSLELEGAFVIDSSGSDCWRIAMNGGDQNS